MPRLKKIELDGAEFTIAPLTTVQVEEFSQSDDTLNGLMFMASTYSVICMGLNNVPQPYTLTISGASGVAQAVGPPWTPERVRNELDIVTVKWLYTEILKFSGLNTEPVEVKPGEPQGAST